MPTSWIISLVLTAALAASGLLLKGQIETNGELKQSLKETNAALERVAGVVREQEAEKKRLSSLLAEREEAIRESSQAASKRKDAARVAVQQSESAQRCTDVLLPADVVRGLRDGAGSGSADGQGRASGASSRWMPTPYDSSATYLW